MGTSATARAIVTPLDVERRQWQLVASLTSLACVAGVVWRWVDGMGPLVGVFAGSAITSAAHAIATPSAAAERWAQRREQALERLIDLCYGQLNQHGWEVAAHPNITTRDEMVAFLTLVREWRAAAAQARRLARPIDDSQITAAIAAYEEGVEYYFRTTFLKLHEQRLPSPVDFDLGELAVKAWSDPAADPDTPVAGSVSRLGAIQEQAEHLLGFAPVR